jgi:hypothetical protein
MTTLYRLLADLVLLFHFGYVAFVVFGLLLVLIGGWRRWQWVRNVWFRGAHLAAILIVVAESWLDIVCPLTTLENSLRTLAGQATHRESFIADFVHRILFITAPPWAFTAVYTLFGLAVLATLLWLPPRRRGPHTSSSN